MHARQLIDRLFEDQKSSASFGTDVGGKWVHVSYSFWDNACKFSVDDVVESGTGRSIIGELSGGVLAQLKREAEKIEIDQDI